MDFLNKIIKVRVFRMINLPKFNCATTFGNFGKDNNIYIS